MPRLRREAVESSLVPGVFLDPGAREWLTGAGTVEWLTTQRVEIDVVSRDLLEVGPATRRHVALRLYLRAHGLTWQAARDAGVTGVAQPAIRERLSGVGRI